MHKKEVIVELNCVSDEDILIWKAPKDWLPPIPVKKELIRCKDCAYYLHGACDNNEIYVNMIGDLIGVHFEPEPDFFCKYAERKEE